MLAVSDELASRVAKAIEDGRVSSADEVVEAGLRGVLSEGDGPNADELRERAAAAEAGEWDELSLADMKAMVREKSGVV